MNLSPVCSRSATLTVAWPTLIDCVPAHRAPTGPGATRWSPTASRWRAGSGGSPTGRTGGSRSSCAAGATARPASGRSSGWPRRPAGSSAARSARRSTVARRTAGRCAVPGGALTATDDELRVDLGDDARLDAPVRPRRSRWPRRAYGGARPRSGRPADSASTGTRTSLGARVDGRLRLGDDEWAIDDAIGYAEKNWGTGFPQRWWWGQASGIGGDDDACVAFAGGDVSVGPVRLAPTAGRRAAGRRRRCGWDRRSRPCGSHDRPRARWRSARARRA